MVAWAALQGAAGIGAALGWLRIFGVLALLAGFSTATAGCGTNGGASAADRAERAGWTSADCLTGMVYTCGSNALASCTLPKVSGPASEWDKFGQCLAEPAATCAYRTSVGCLLETAGAAFGPGGIPEPVEPEGPIGVIGTFQAALSVQVPGGQADVYEEALLRRALVKECLRTDAFRESCTSQQACKAAVATCLRLGAREVPQ